MDKSGGGGGLYGTLPKSMRETRLVTKVKESGEGDEEKMKERQQLVSSATPAELGAIRGFSDIPVPTLFKSKRSRSGSAQRPERKRKYDVVFRQETQDDCL